jgi:hypothetical protein
MLHADPSATVRRTDKEVASNLVIDFFAQRLADAVRVEDLNVPPAYSQLSMSIAAPAALRLASHPRSSSRVI